MKVPLSWLKEYVSFDASPRELADRLTFAGMEVESVETMGRDYPGIVVAEVLSIAPHPNADRLVLCRVSDGKQDLKVVCGARNFAVGDKVPFAGIGTVLPNGMEIKSAKLRGEESLGMLCAEDELGISEDHSGLMILAKDLPAGKPFSEVMGPPEVVLAIEVTPNRPDCLSILGIAREVAALYGGKAKLPSVEFAETGGPVEEKAGVRIKDTDGCPRYTARVLTTIAIKPSPGWMQQRLAWCGIRPINNVVDITNYVMLECGQPLHAFDHRLLEEASIIVRRAAKGEVMATLDGAPHELSPEMLVIADSAKPVAVAGVMGGASSGILPDTSTVLLESACFKPSLVRRCSKLLGLVTESSYRFERGVDVRLADWASRRAAKLMVELAGGTAACGVIDAFPKKPKERKISCRFDRARKLLGVDIPDDEIVRIFESLELPVASRKRQTCVVQVPTFRPDLENEADLIEEVARIHGLDKIPMPAPCARIVPQADDTPTRATIRCRAAMTGVGLSEVMNYSFISNRLLALFDPEVAASGPAAERRPVVLPNPISAEHTMLRMSLIPQLVETLGRNHSRQIDQAALFEIGRVFHKASDGALREEDRLAVGIMGPVGRFGFEKRRGFSSEDSFLWLKGIFEEMIQALDADLAMGALKDSGLEQGLEQAHGLGFPVQAFERGEAVTIYIRSTSVVCGVIGVLSETLRREWRLLEPAAVLEVLLAPVAAHAFDVPSAQSLPAYPSVVRDVAMLVDEAVKHEDVLRTIHAAAPEELVGVELFDIYRGGGLGAGKKSMAYSLTYRSSQRTLTDEEANQFHASVKAALAGQLKAEIREK